MSERAKGAAGDGPLGEPESSAAPMADEVYEELGDIPGELIGLLG